jgi:flagellar biosynthetic protein FlhB
MARDSDPRFPATPRRRQLARDAGQIPVSRDLTRAVLLVSAAFLLLLFGPALVSFVIDLTQRQLTSAVTNAGPQYWVEQWQTIVLGFAAVFAPIVAGMIVIALGCHLVQTGFLFRPGSVAPDAARISPSRGWARMFSWGNAAHVGFGLMKAVTIVAVGGLALYSMRGQLVVLTAAEPRQAAAIVGSVLARMLIYVSLALVGLALFDYFAQRWRFERSIDMTAEEMREEVKNQDGSPEISARRRKVQRSLVKGRPVSAPTSE